MEKAGTRKTALAGVRQSQKDTVEEQIVEDNDFTFVIRHRHPISISAERR